MSKVKIADAFDVEEDHDLNDLLGDGKTPVKKGDQYIITSRGWVRYISGKACGNIVIPNEKIEVEGYNNENISILIYKELDKYFGLEEILEENDITKEKFVEEIEDIISDFLN